MAEEPPPFRVVVWRSREDGTAARCPLCGSPLTMKPQWARCRVPGLHTLVMRRVYLPCRREVLVQYQPVARWHGGRIG